MVILLALGASKIDNDSADFGQTKNWSYSKIPLGETEYLSRSLPPGFSHLWRSAPDLSSTQTSFGFLLFFINQASSFFICSLSQHSQLGYLWLPTPHCCSTCVTYRMPLHKSSYQMLHPYLGKQRIALGVTSILSMRLCSHTLLDYNQLIIWYWYLTMSKQKLF